MVCGSTWQIGGRGLSAASTGAGSQRGCWQNRNLGPEGSPVHPLLQFLVQSPVTQRSFPFLDETRAAGFFAGKVKVPVMAFSLPSSLPSIRVSWPQVLSAHPSLPYRKCIQSLSPHSFRQSRSQPPQAAYRHTTSQQDYQPHTSHPKTPLHCQQSAGKRLIFQGKQL